LRDLRKRIHPLHGHEQNGIQSDQERERLLRMEAEQKAEERLQARLKAEAEANRQELVRTAQIELALRAKHDAERKVLEEAYRKEQDKEREVERRIRDEYERTRRADEELARYKEMVHMEARLETERRLESERRKHELQLKEIEWRSRAAAGDYAETSMTRSPAATMTRAQSAQIRQPYFSVMDFQTGGADFALTTEVINQIVRHAIAEQANGVAYQDRPASAFSRPAWYASYPQQYAQPQPTYHQHPGFLQGDGTGTSAGQAPTPSRNVTETPLTLGRPASSI